MKKEFIKIDRLSIEEETMNELVKRIEKINNVECSPFKSSLHVFRKPID